MKFLNDLSQLRKAGKKKEKAKINVKSLVRIYKVFGRHYRKYIKTLALAFMSLFLVIAISVLRPWPLKLIIDNIILKKPFPEKLAGLQSFVAADSQRALLVLASSIIVLVILKAFFSYLNKFWFAITGYRIIADIRERVFHHLQRLSLSFHDSSCSGNLIYLLTSDTVNMKDILIDFPQRIIWRLGTFITYTILMVMLDWRLALITLSTVPLFYFFTSFFGAGMKNALKIRRKQESNVASIISENMVSMALIKAFGREDTERDRFANENKQSLAAQLRALRLQKTYSRILDFLVTLSTAGVLYYGGRFALGGEILPGTLIIFVAYLRDIYGSVEEFSTAFLKLAKALVSGERLLEIVENDMILRDDPQAVSAPPFKGRIEFKNVSFAYKRGKDVLKNLNFRVNPGETVALIGHSGAGKSTLISLLLRFYDPQNGQILIDGQDIRQFTLKSLRSQMTILLQEAKLFQQTVKENIGFGKINATELEIIQAAKLAEAHDFIQQLPKGYDTMMYEGGENLSGGQRQRINIARAIIRNTPIVFLDEPATGLDAMAEAKINAAIHRLTQNKTTFIIAHKFSTIINADKILLLEGGEIAHLGTHDQLMRESSTYRELYHLQFGDDHNLPKESFDKSQAPVAHHRSSLSSSEL